MSVNRQPYTSMILYIYLAWNVFHGNLALLHTGWGPERVFQVSVT